MAIDLKDFNLVKKVEKLDKFLLTKGLHTAPTVRVGVALDISGSMSSIIARGDLQKTLDQLTPVGIKFDDNGELDVFKFDTRCDHVGTVNQNNYSDYVRRNRIEARGGTSYAPIVEEAVKYFFGKSGGLMGMFSKTSSQEPVLLQIVTDGDCGDARQTERLMVEAQKYPIYFQFVAVGRASFPTIKHLADLLPNVGDVYLRDFGLSDDEVYEQVVSEELVQWLGKP